MNNTKELISLKEAAAVSGYSADYIGQLIRDGKIYGKQVYVNISWMTTAEAVMAYKNMPKSKEKGSSFKTKLALQKRKFDIQLNILQLFFQTFKSALPIMAVLISSFLLLSIFLLSLFFDIRQKTPSFPEAPPQAEKPLTF